MSDRDTFVSDRQERWDKLELLLGAGWRARDAAYWSELSFRYRALCADLARAQSLELGEDVQRYLDHLASRVHNQLYGVRGRSQWWNVFSLLGQEFPRTVRRNWVLFLAANLLFYGPFIIGCVGALYSREFAATVLPEQMLMQMEASYGSEEVSRGAGGDAMMAGFYVWNNIGIAFRCFATGALGGLGTVFYLVYNGLVIGTVEGHVWATGGGWNLLTFTAGHSAWELTGIIVAGTAGLRLGLALVMTKGRTRVYSLREAAPDLFRLVVGATALLAIAAAIEGFWSASPVPAPIKWAFGLVGVAIVAAWLLFGGRGARA